ncbi:MAG: PAS domain S-box protein [Pseudomonadota bacterium]
MKDEKKTKKQLIDELTMLRAIIENTRDIIYSADPEGTVTYVSPRTSMFGYEREDIVGHGFAEFIHPDDIKHAMEDFIRTMETGEEFPTVFRMKTGDGSYVWVEEIGKAMREGDAVVQVTGVIRDITERKQAEEALSRSEERLKTVLENIDDVIVQLSLEGVIEYVSPNVKEQYGYDPESLVGEHLEMVTPPDQLRKAQGALETVLSGIPVRQLEINLIDSTEKIVSMEVSLTPVRKGGEIVGVQSVMRDITRRRKAEEAHRESEERYRAIFEGSNDGILVADTGTRKFRFANPAMCRFLGYVEGELLALGVDDIHPPGELQAIIRNFERQVRGEITLVENVPCLRKDGKVVYADIRVNPLTMSNRLFNVGFFRDVTGRRQAEEEIRKFKTIAESARFGVAIAGLDGTVSYINDYFAGVHGYRPDEILGNRLDMFHTAEQLDQVANINEKLLAVGSYSGIEVWHRCKDGSVFPMLMNGVIVKDEKGVPQYMAATAVDITGRKHAEERIKASLREKEVLLKEIHHRVKNNLQLITSLLKLQSESVGDPGALEMFRESQGRVRLIALLHEMLYRSEDLASIDAADYIRTLVSHLLRSYGGSGEAITVELNVEKITLDVDTAITCGLIVNELVTNSLKHAFPGGGEGKVRVDLHPKGHGAFILTVADSGKGIAGSIDFRDARTLGLQLVCTLVDQLEGTIELDREGGTAFRIEFMQT